MDIIIEGIHLIIKRGHIKRCFFCLVLKSNLILPNAYIYHTLSISNSVLIVVCYFVCGLFLNGESFRQLAFFFGFYLLDFLFFGFVTRICNVVVFKLKLPIRACTSSLHWLFQLLILDLSRLCRILFWESLRSTWLVLTHCWLNEQRIIITACIWSSQIAFKRNLPTHYRILHKTKSSSIRLIRLDQRKVRDAEPRHFWFAKVVALTEAQLAPISSWVLKETCQLCESFWKVSLVLLVLLHDVHCFEDFDDFLLPGFVVELQIKTSASYQYFSLE